MDTTICELRALAFVGIDWLMDTPLAFLVNPKKHRPNPPNGIHAWGFGIAVRYFMLKAWVEPEP